MRYKAYDNKKTVSQRMSRKRSRSTTFMANKKMKKLAKKLKSEQEASQDE